MKACHCYLPWKAKHLSRFRFVLLLVLLSHLSFAQCSDWYITAQLTTAATCAANGNFSVVVSGPDASNITNLQYGIPSVPGGYSVPLNSSAVFANVPAGTYQVSAVGSCGGNLVGRNTNVEMPGNYIPPFLTLSTIRESLYCGAYGKLNVYINWGLPPFSIQITNAPFNYSGPLTFTASTNGYVINNLPPGSYTVQVVDACGSGTAPATQYINALDPLTMPLSNYNPASSACNVLEVPMPYLPSNNTSWYGYENDPMFQVSVQISGNLCSPTAYEPITGSGFSVHLPAGKTIKDCYGETITYTIMPPCGPSIQLSSVIPFLDIGAEISQHCNVDFVADLTAFGAVCLPITYSFHNNSSGQNYGPFTAGTFPINTASLPLGSSTLNSTKGDGYTGIENFGATPISGTPYSVSIESNGSGLNNYIEGFVFSTSGPTTVKTVELFNGPSGFSYIGSWNDNNIYMVSQNMTPGPGSQFFPQGSYVWKITDDCGSYLLPVTVGPSDLYQYTVGIDSQRQTCNGLMVWPNGTAMHNGQNVPVHFSLLKDDYPLFLPGNIWPQIAAGDSFLISSPGHYTIMPSAGSETFYEYDISYPNVYTVTANLDYNVHPVQVNIDSTQGFLCKGTGPGQGKIYAKGKDGRPFQPPLHYNYYLAHQNQGVSGPYLATNTTGSFSGFGGNTNDIYEVKIEDHCGAFAVQRVKILDLQTARLISSSSYAACQSDTVQLQAIYLPGASYSWTGPGGFTSSLQNPFISNIGAQNIGVYYVTVTTPVCSQAVTDSTMITLNPNPPAPVISVSCGPPQTTLVITNPDAQFDYLWEYSNYGFSYEFPADLSFTLTPGIGGFAAIAIDSSTGCFSKSDTVFFSGDPNQDWEATIYSPHLQLCPGDTAILVAQGPYGDATYQWFQNNVPIPGATGISYIAGIAGDYSVGIYSGPCNSDTSDVVSVVAVSPPQASITASAQFICAGDSVVIQANTGAGYTYTWHQNGTTIPGAQTSQLAATASGNYYVTVSNGGCIANSNTLPVTVYPAPAVQLTPANHQYLCTDDTVHFSTLFDPAYSYSWTRDGNPIAGNTTNSLITATDGVYMVTVSTPMCPAVMSVPVAVSHLPMTVDLGPDTVVCLPGPFAIQLSVVSGFSQVLWSDGSTGNQLTATAGGTFWVSATNACGTFSDTFRVQTLYDYLPDLPVDTIVCNATNSAELSVPAGLDQILWSTGANTAAITVTSPGLYWMEGLSPCGVVRDTVNVRFCSPLIQSIELSDDTICETDCIYPGAAVINFPQTYTWSFPGGSPAASATPDPGMICYEQAGVYPVTLTVTNAGGRDSMSTEIVVMSKPVPRFADTAMTLSYKTELFLPACAEALQANWYQDGSLICENCVALPLTALYWQSVYQCVVSNGNCSDTCSYKLMVTDIPSDLWLPDVFSPNGDGKNDYFSVITDNPNVSLVDLSVYNRWGQHVHWGSGPKGWDGSFGGTQADMGTYFWLLKYRVTGNDMIFVKKGEVILVR